MFSIAQDENVTFERPKTELTIGISNIKLKDDLTSLILYDNYYDYYPYYYVPTGNAAFNIGLRKKVKNGALRLQGEFGMFSQSTTEETDSQNGGSQYTGGNLASINSGGKIGYDFFKSYKILEINYGFDIIVNYSSFNVKNGYDYYDYTYNPSTGQYDYFLSYSYVTKDKFSEISFGLGLNVGAGLRISEKVKVGIESNLNFLYGITAYDHTNGASPDYDDSNTGSTFKSKIAPLGLIYIAFGI